MSRARLTLARRLVDGLAAMVIVGADTGGGADAGGVTLTAADAVVDPPEPVQTNI